jgi:hypothetical protein
MPPLIQSEKTLDSFLYLPQQSEIFSFLLAIDTKNLKMLVYLWELNQPESKTDFLEEEIGIKQSKCFKWTHHHLSELFEALSKANFTEALQTIMLSKTTTSIYLSLTHQEQMTITKKFLISKKYHKSQDLRKQFKSEFVKMPYATVTLFVLINDKIENLNE